MMSRLEEAKREIAVVVAQKSKPESVSASFSEDMMKKQEELISSMRQELKQVRVPA